MKKDFLKEFVSDNKDSFDEFEPSVDMLSKIQSQLGLDEKKDLPKSKVVSFKYWWAAAAVLVLLVGLTLLMKQKDSNINQLVETKKPSKDNVLMQKDSVHVAPSVEKIVSIEKVQKRKPRTAQKSVSSKNVQEFTIDTSTVTLASNNMDWKKDLDPTNSSSVRLTAVLTSGKQNNLSFSDMELLANTMNNDESSNVRLAALDVLGKQSNQSEVKPLILQSVAKQDDPIVQMELLSLLSPEEASSVKKQLLAITQNPMSIEAVRNQAYAALLRSKTNF